ncbi:retroviral-like aspartic protease 1 [Styela clava]
MTNVCMDHDFDNLICSLRLPTSWYAMVDVNGITVRFLIDSGSAATLIDYAVFCSIGGKECDLSPCDVCFQTANCTSLKARGMIDLKICIDSVCAVQRVIIADLGAPYGLLGMDYFQEHDCVLHMSVG